MHREAHGTPWPPFDFGSGMGVESVDRADAIALGIIAPDQRPVTKLDIEVLPHVWREPDTAAPGDKPRSLVFWNRILGITRMIEWIQNPKTNVMIPSSVLVKKETAG